MERECLRYWKLCIANPRRVDYKAYELMGARENLYAYPSDYGVNESKLFDHFCAALGITPKELSGEFLVRGRIDMELRTVEFFNPNERALIEKINSDLLVTSEVWRKKLKGFKILVAGTQIYHIKPSSKILVRINAD